MKYKISLFLYLILKLSNLFCAQASAYEELPLFQTNFEFFGSGNEMRLEKYDKFSKFLFDSRFVTIFYKIENNLRVRTAEVCCYRATPIKTAVIEYVEITNDYFSKDEIFEFMKKICHSFQIKSIYYRENDKWQIYLLK